MALTERGHLFLPRRWHRPVVIKWLRRTHAWLGLWGAVLGLLFGSTGFLLNHRAVMKIPAAANVETESRIELAEPLPAYPAQLVAILQHELRFERAPTKLSVEPARIAPWGGGAIQQPERWQINFATPNATVLVEYWVGNRTVGVKRLDPNTFAWLTRLHMSTGADAAWILLADTLAGALIFLSLSGLLLWTRLHGPRLAALGLLGTCSLFVVGLALSGG